MGNCMQVEDLQVYQKLCQLHIEICDLTGKWPAEEHYEECVRMLNGLEKKLESQLPESERRWPADDSKGS
jgi:hypothetical protein